MIIITGPGRSGTSALALLYRELGFDPGGGWTEPARAGLENEAFWRFNAKLAAAIHTTMLHPPKPPRGQPAAPAAAGLGRLTRTGRRRLARALTGPKPPKPKPAMRNANGRVRMTDWAQLPRVVEEHREKIVQLSAETVVVKDPRFLWTLPVWLAAGAHIDHVVVTIRAMDDMIASRHAAAQSEFNRVELRNTLTYGIGSITAALHESGVPHSFVRFPDFLHDVDGLYQALVFPQPVTLERFRAAAAQVFDPTQVHDWGAASH